jgi:hypothetical protein
MAEGTAIPESGAGRQRGGRAYWDMQRRCAAIAGSINVLISCAANLALQGGVKSADGKAVLALGSVWSLLLFNILPDNRNRRSAATPCKVAG